MPLATNTGLPTTVIVACSPDIASVLSELIPTNELAIPVGSSVYPDGNTTCICPPTGIGTTMLKVMIVDVNVSAALVNVRTLPNHKYDFINGVPEIAVFCS